MGGMRIFTVGNEDMNTEIAARVIGAGLAGRAEFEGLEVWMPTDDVRETERGLMVSVSGADEVVACNRTYKVSGEVVYRERYGEVESGELVCDVTEFGCAVAEVVEGCVGMVSGDGDGCGYAVLWGNVSPAVAGVSDTYLVYKCGWEMVIQF